MKRAHALTRRFHLLLSPHDEAKLEALAEAEEVKASQVLRALIRSAYAANPKIDPKRLKP